MCTVIGKLSSILKRIEEEHGIELDEEEVNLLKRLLCKYVCGGKCRGLYDRILQ